WPFPARRGGRVAGHGCPRTRYAALGIAGETRGEWPGTDARGPDGAPIAPDAYTLHYPPA
ncbi:MAG: hypothetical protein WCH91_13795, partial [bacterium]